MRNLAFLAAMLSLFGAFSCPIVMGGPISLQNFPSGEEISMEPVFGYVPAPDRQLLASSAFGGENYLVVWEDYRQGTDIYGARVNLEGKVLDPIGIPICTASSPQRAPDVAFDGENYFVVWDDGRNGTYNSDIYGTRVTLEGEVLDPEGIPISVAPGHQHGKNVAFGGENYLVVWTDRRNLKQDIDIYGTLVTPDGVVLDTAGIPINRGPDDQFADDVAFDGTNYLVTWWHHRHGYSNTDVYGCRVTTEGVPLDTLGIPISTASNGQGPSAVSFGDSVYLVVWIDRIGTSSALYGTRMLPDGTVLDTLGFPISDYPHTWSPEIIYNGVNFFVVFEQEREYPWRSDIYCTRVTPGGDVLDPEGIPIITGEAIYQYPTISFDGTDCLIAWNTGDIWGGRFTTSGIPLDSIPFTISTTLARQTYPSAACDGSTFLIAWSETDGSSYTPQIKCGRLSNEGIALDSVGRYLGNRENKKYSPSVCLGEGVYMAVWQEIVGDSAVIFGTRMALDGVPLDSLGFYISLQPGYAMEPDVAFDGLNYLVVWHTSYQQTAILGARVNGSGQVLDSIPIVISSAPNVRDQASVVYNGTDYLVVWRDHRDYPWYSEVYCARVTSHGEVLDSGGVRITSVAEDKGKPRITTDSNLSLVVWSDRRNSDDDIFGCRITHDGVPLDTSGFAIVELPQAQEEPDVVFDGTNFLVIWQDERNGNWDVYAARVSPDGVVIDTGGFEICTSSEDEKLPCGATDIDGGFIFYSKHLPAPLNSDRIYGVRYVRTGIEEKESPKKVFLIWPSSPNPLQEKTVIKYQLPKSSIVHITIYNLLGREIRTLVDAERNAGLHTVIWDGRDYSGRKVSSGTYFLRLEAGEHTATRKLCVMR